MLALATIAPALPGIEQEFVHDTACPLITRLVLTVPAAGIAVIAPLAGPAVARIGARRVLLAALPAYATLGTVGPWIDGLAGLLASRAALGVAVALIVAAVTVLIRDVTDRRERRKLLGLQGVVMGLGGAVFFAGGGLLADVSWSAPFLIHALALLLIPVVLVTVPPRRATPGPPTGAPSAVRTPFTALFAVYGLAFSGVALFFMVPVQLPFVLTQHVVVTRHVVAGAPMSGLVIAVCAVAAALSAARYRQLRDHLSEYGVAALLLALMAAGFTLIAVAEDVPTVAGAMLLVGAGVGLLVPNCTSWALCLIPTALRGRALGGLTAAVFAGAFVSPIVAAPLLAWAGLQGQFVAAGAILAIAAVIFVWLTRVHARMA